MASRPDRVTRVILILGLLGLAGCDTGVGTQPVSAGAGPPADFAGIWVPDGPRAEAWPSPLPLTGAGREFTEKFDPAQHDPTGYCLPFGTPRNMLQTQYPLEIAQTDQLLLMIIQPNLANPEVRRIALDGREHPGETEPSWFGTSTARWEGATLVIETTGLRPDALVSGSGIGHSGELRVVERLSLATDDDQGKVLLNQIELHDPVTFQEPVTVRRYFNWAPSAQMQEGNCVELKWIDRLWRERLQEHAGTSKEGT